MGAVVINMSGMKVFSILFIFYGVALGDTGYGAPPTYHSPPSYHASPPYHPPPPPYHAPEPVPAYHAPVPAPAYHAPVVHAAPAYHAEPVYSDEPSPYNYEYGVHDDYSGTTFNAGEHGDGHGNVEGSFSVALPDGRIQHVSYHSDPYGGYVADVTYEGTAQYEKYHSQPAYHQPAYHAPAYHQY